MITTHYFWHETTNEAGELKRSITHILVVPDAFDTQFERYMSCYIGAMKYGSQYGCAHITFQAEQRGLPNPKIQSELEAEALKLGFSSSWRFAS